MHAWKRLVAWLKSNNSRMSVTTSAARVTDTKKSMPSAQALQSGPANSANLKGPDTRDLQSEDCRVASTTNTPLVPLQTTVSAANLSSEQLENFLLLLREPSPGASREDHLNMKGKSFEQTVGTLLNSLKFIAGDKVVIETQPRLSLQNGEVVVPDFHLTVELSHERRHYLIECRDRERDSKDILHKIRHVRDKQRWQTFLFLYPKQISPELARALDAEGIMHLDLEGLRLFVLRLGGELYVVHRELPRLLRDIDIDVDLDGDKPQGARLSSR